MKIIALSLMAIGATGSAWAWLGPDLSAPAEPPEISQARAKAGARQMLSDHPRLDVHNLVLGRHHPGSVFDFRGRLLQGGRMKPAYGQVRPTCDNFRQRPDCWEITHMEIDGRHVVDLASLGAAPLQGAGPAAGPTDASPADASGAPAKAPGQALSGAVAMASMPEPAESTPDDAPAATHRVARPIINARSGPGTDHPVIAKLQDGVLLELLDSQTDWGRFRVIDSANAGKRVWAALRILEEVE